MLTDRLGLFCEVLVTVLRFIPEDDEREWEMLDETTGRRRDRSREWHLGDITDWEQRSFNSGVEHRLAEEKNRKAKEDIALWNEGSGALLEKYKMLSDKVEDAYEHGIIGAREAKRRLKSLTQKYEQSAKGARKWWPPDPDDNLPDPKDAASLLKEVVRGSYWIRYAKAWPITFYWDLADLEAWRSQFAVMKKSMPRLEEVMGTDDDEFLKIETDVNALGEAIKKEDDHFLQAVKEVVSELDEREALDDDQSDFRQVLRGYLDKRLRNNESRMRFNPATRRGRIPALRGNPQGCGVVVPANYRFRL